MLIFMTIFVYVLFLLSGLRRILQTGRISQLQKKIQLHTKSFKQPPHSPLTQSRSVPELPPSKGPSKQSRSRSHTFSASSRSSAPTPTSHGQSTFFLPTPQPGGKVDD